MIDPPDIDRLLSTYRPQEAVIAEAMVSLYRTRLFHLALSMLRDINEADDAVQHTFLKAYLNLRTYQPGTNFKAWLFRIAVNNCLGMLRRRKTRHALTQWLRFTQPQPEPSPGPEETLLQGESARQLWSAVGLLGEKHRLVILLRYQQEMPVREIAQVLSTSDKTVYTRLYEALKQLRANLAVDEESGRREAVYQEDAR